MPVDEPIVNLSEKAKPSVNEPRIITKTSDNNEWLSNNGRWRMIRTPNKTIITGIRIPNSPNERSTSHMPNRAPAQPQKFFGSMLRAARSAADIGRPLWSSRQQK